MNNYYQEIFKRKSFHLFRNVGDDKITQKELDDIYKVYSSFDSLYPDIKTDIRIKKAEEINFKRDAEYCILIYSENKDNYLMNAGYIGEQLDLYLVRHNIGTLWFGIGKPDIEEYENMSFVIMIAIHKINDETLFRKDMFKSKRKALNEIWEGNILEFSDIIRYTPSACNSQPWYVKNEDNILKIYRYKKVGKRGIMPANAVAYYNRIDIGIFLCFLEICLMENKIDYKRTLYLDLLDDEYNKVAEYDLNI